MTSELDIVSINRIRERGQQEMNIPTPAEAKDQFLTASRNGQAAGRRAVKAGAVKAATAASAVPKPRQAARRLVAGRPKPRLSAQLPRPAGITASTRQFAAKLLGGERRLAAKVLHTPKAPNE
jgi:hypothetical protein